MANNTYDIMWQEAISDLGEQVRIEHVKHTQQGDDPSVKPPEISIIDAFQHFACLYIKYMQIFERLERCYDSMVHPQKRLDVKMSLDLVIRRVIELKHLLVKWNPPNPDVRVETGRQPNFPWEYINLDDILQDLKLPPGTMEVPVPRYFKEDYREEHKQRDKLVKGYMKLKLGSDTLPVEDVQRSLDVPTTQLTLEQAIEAIQRNERGRQGKQRANFVKELREEDKRRKNYVDKSMLEMDPEIAAANIQRLFRGYFSRAKAQTERDEELVFIGMRPKSTNNDELVSDLKQAYKKRKQEQIDNKEAYEKALEDLKEVVLEEEGPEMRDELRNERTQWITDSIATSNEIPDNLEGFYLMKNPPPEEEGKEEDDGGGKKKKDDKKKDDKGKKDKKGKKEVVAKEIELPSLDGYSNLTQTMDAQCNEYSDIWLERDESENFAQKHDAELAKDRIIREQVNAELEKQVDEMLVMNLSKIKQLHADAKGKKGKKGKGKKGKGKKGKGKKEKPLPGAKISELKNMDTDFMLSILVENRIVNNPADNKIADLVGDFNYLGSVHQHQKKGDQKQRWIPQNPSMAQLRASLTEYCILPNGLSSTVRKEIDETNNVRSLLLYGPKGSGKTMMVQAIANELGALFINLSAERLKGNPLWEGKQGPTKVIHMAFTVAKDPTYAPVVIYIDDAQDFFENPKKKGKDKPDKNGPIKFQKDLMIYKNQALTVEDKVIVIGSTREPEKADPKLLKWKGKTGKPEKQGFFEKFLYFPYPDYPDRVMLWRKFITKMLREGKSGDTGGGAGGDGGKKGSGGTVAIPDTFDVSSLAHISEGYTAGAIAGAVMATLTQRRVQSLEKRPLQETEFLNFLARQEVTYVEDAKRFLDFTCKITDLDARKKKIEDDKKNADGGGDGKDAKKGKKKK